MQSEPKPKTFCQICRHPTDEGEGHYKNCPVYTGEPVVGAGPGYWVQQDMHPQNHAQQEGLGHLPGQYQMGNLSYVCPYCGGLNGIHQWSGEGTCPGVSTHWSQYGISNPINDGYEVARIYREARERLLEELKAQVEVNRRLTRDLIDVRLELAALKIKHGIT